MSGERMSPEVHAALGKELDMAEVQMSASRRVMAFIAEHSLADIKADLALRHQLDQLLKASDKAAAEWRAAFDEYVRVRGAKL